MSMPLHLDLADNNGSRNSYSNPEYEVHFLFAFKSCHTLSMVLTTE